MFRTLKISPRIIFDKTIDIVFSVMLIFITLAVILGLGQLFYTLIEMISTPGAVSHYHKMISDLLSLFILIELSRSLVDYFNTHRIRLTYIVDAALVFVLREIMIRLFEKKIVPEEIYALSALLLVMGIIRIGAVWSNLQTAKSAIIQK